MNIPIEIVVAVLVAFFGMQAWTLKAVVGLKTEVALLKERVRFLSGEDVEIKYGHTSSHHATRANAARG